VPRIELAKFCAGKLYEYVKEVMRIEKMIFFIL